MIFFSCNLQIFRIPVKGMKWKQMFPVMLAPNIPHSKTEYFQAPLKAFQENSHLSNVNKNKGWLFFLIKKNSGFSTKENGPGIEGHTVSLKPDENLSLVLSSPSLPYCLYSVWQNHWEDRGAFLGLPISISFAIWLSISACFRLNCFVPLKSRWVL